MQTAGGLRAKSVCATMPEFSVVIVGGGASGVLLAARLVQKSPSVRISIIESRPTLGRGMAYSTPHEEHLLNVPAGRMSAYGEDPEHFVRFLRERFANRFEASSFVPRPFYGDYLETIARDAHNCAGERFNHLRVNAVAANVDAGGVRVISDDGVVVRGDVLVVATGNAQPAPWMRANAEILAGDRFFDSAWDAGALRGADHEGTILLLGTGLTAVDAVIGLRANGHRGTIWMVSRRGLLPHEHRLFDAPPDINPDATSMRDLLDAARAVGRGSQSWRASLDSLRPRTNALWQALSLDDKRRFVRHVMPYWNVHRHRMAPEVAAAISDEISAGTLRMLAGRTGRFEATGTGLRVPIALRGEQRTIEIEICRAINCSGPAHDPRLLDNPLVGNLLAQGIMHVSELGIGINVAPSGALRDANNVDSQRAFSIGPVRYGTLIETTAIPEIRAQADELATSLAFSFDRTQGEAVLR
jgi:uncharacterized NAD(P)/FAD-binding protein YdhS